MFFCLWTCSQCYGMNRCPLSFGTQGALASCRDDGRVAFVCGVRSDVQALDPAIAVIVITVVVVLHTQEPVAVILEDSRVAELQLLQLLPQFIPLLILLLLPVNFDIFF